MTIPLTTAGGLMTRLGHIFGGVQDVNAIRGGTATARVLSGANWMTRGGTLETDYAAGPANQQTLDGIYQSIASWQSSQSGFLNSSLSQLAANTLIKMADQDVALASKDVTTALKLLVSQMKAASASVQQSAVAAGAQTAIGTPSGNAVIVSSAKDGAGLALQYAFPEILTFLCTGDSQTGGGTLNQEPVSIKGAAAVGDTFSHLWPGGSGVSTSQTAVDGSLNNSGGNKLNNSSFEAFAVANTPDGWVIAVGTAGTDVLKETSIVYDGSAALKLAGGTAVQTSLTQTFNVSSAGTAGTLAPLTPYALNLFLKADVVPATGVLTVDLIDGTNTVINDAQGAANTFTVNLSGVTTSYAARSGVFRTPAVLPATAKLRFRLSTVLPAGSNLYIDRMAFTAMTQAYAGGPYFGIFSGNSKLIVNDSWTVATTNTYGVLQQYFERTFGMRQLGLVLPFSGSPTVSDTLVA